MALTRKEFEILVCFEKKIGESLTQRHIAKITGMSLGTVNKCLTELSQKKYIFDNKITENGIIALEPFKVKRAVILAAGFGSRLVPVTLNTPKPLVRVKGERMIDTLLDAIVKMGIEDITIVRGYLGEQFDQLLYKYPNIKFVENPFYNEANNISSAMVVRYLLRNAYVFEADLVLVNPDILSKYHYCSNYLGVKTELTDDWCFETKDKIITKVKIGGTDCYHMFGISFWNESDGARMSEHIKKVYEMPGGKERYWDQVALEYFINEYKIEVNPCSFNDIVEIDTYKDLKKMDSTYC